MKQARPTNEAERQASMKRVASALNYFDSTPRVPPDHVINWYTWGS